MLGGLFSGVASVIGSLMQSQAQQEAMDIARENLAFQKEVTGEQLDLAKSTREDAYGNIVRYNDRTDTWDIVLTPQQRKILSAGEQEQLLGLTEDAARSRDLRRRQEVRSKQAGGAYQEAFEDFFNKQPKPEEAYQGEAIGEVARAMAAREGKAAQDTTRTALRIGEGGQVENILRALSNRQGASLPEAILEGKQLGTARSTAAEAAHRGKYSPQMEFFSKLMDNIGAGSQRFSTAPSETGQAIREMLAAMGSAYNNKSSAVGGAYGTLINAAGASPDFSGIINSLGKFGGGLDSLFAGGNDYLSAGQVEPTGSFGAPAPGLNERVGTSGTPSASVDPWTAWYNTDQKSNLWG